MNLPIKMFLQEVVKMYRHIFESVLVTMILYDNKVY